MSKAVQELSEWISSNAEETQKKRNETLVLAQQSEIAEMLNAGFTMAIVWKFFKAKGRYSGCYASFTYHCRKYIKPKLQTQKPASTKKETTQTSQPPSKEHLPVFNQTSAPTKQASSSALNEPSETIQQKFAEHKRRVLEQSKTEDDFIPPLDIIDEPKRTGPVIARVPETKKFVWNPRPPSDEELFGISKKNK